MHSQNSHKEAFIWRVKSSWQTIFFLVVEGAISSKKVSFKGSAPNPQFVEQLDITDNSLFFGKKVFLYESLHK
jgi:hypothetical protein